MNYETIISDYDKILLSESKAIVRSKLIIRNPDHIGHDIVLTESDAIKTWEHIDERYVPNVGWIGQFVARELNGELQNIDDDFNIENKEIQLLIGVEELDGGELFLTTEDGHNTLLSQDYEKMVAYDTIDDNVRWYSLGTFIVQKPEDDEVNDNTKFQSMDLTIKFNKIFNADFTNEQYPQSFIRLISNGGYVTARWLASYVCEQVGVNFSNNDFTNSDYQISSNQFTNGESCRDVMKAISQLAFGWVEIDWNDICCIRELEMNTNNIADYNKIDNDHYYSLKTQNDKYGVINRIIVGVENIDGEGAYIEDSESIARDGLNELYIYNNPLTYIYSQRVGVVRRATYLLGLNYKPLSIETPGHPWLKGNDLIICRDMEGNEYTTYPFNRKISYSGHIKTSIESIADTQVEKTMAYDESLYKNLKRVGITVDKQNGVIELLNEEITDQNEKVARVVQTVDELNSKISDIADITTSNESVYATVSLENINESEPIMIKIHPIVESISYLYPSSALFPSDNLYLKSRTLRFFNTKTQEIFDWELPTDLWYYDENNYDELVFSYDSQTVYVNRKIGINEDMTTYILDTSTTEEYQFPTISLTEGDYTVYLLGYSNAYLFVRMMASNIYTSQFATKVELNSSITQTKDTIRTEVSETISGVNSEISNVKSSITQTKNSILAEVNDEINQVNGKLDLKVGKNENDQVVSMLNASANQINLTGNRFTVTADNFKLNADGTMTCENATVKGNIESTSGKIGGWTINNRGLSNGRQFIRSDGASTIYTVADLIIIRNYILGKDGFNMSGNMVQHYDLNGDGIVTSSDYATLKNLIGLDPGN